MLAPLSKSVYDLNPPGTVSLAVAVLAGVFVGLAVVPVALTLLPCALIVAALGHTWRRALHWMGIRRSETT